MDINYSSGEDFQKFKFHTRKIPIYALYVLNWIIYQESKRSWVNKIILMGTFIIHMAGFSVLVVMYVGFTIPPMYNNSKYTIFKYVNIAVNFYPFILVCLYIWKSYYQKNCINF